MEKKDPITKENYENGYGGKLNKVVNAVQIALLMLFSSSILWGCSDNKTAPPEQAIAANAGTSASILPAFEEAFESGEYEQVRALFTEDGVLTTASNVHDAIIRGDASQLADRVDEDEFRRLATIHGGEDFNILGEPLPVGENTLAFAWEWGTDVSGTALMHLREGKIVICILNPSQYQIPFTER